MQLETLTRSDQSALILNINEYSVPIQVKPIQSNIIFSQTSFNNLKRTGEWKTVAQTGTSESTVLSY